MLLYLTLSAMINGITSFLLSVYSLVNNLKKSVNKAFSFFAFNVSLWSIAYFFWQISDDRNQAIFLSRLLMLGSILIPSSFYFFIVTFLKEKKKRKKSLSLCFILSMIFILANFTPYFVSGVEQKLYFKYWPVPGVFFHGFILYFHFYFLYGIFVALKKYKHLTYKEKNQVKYILLGCFLGGIGGTTNHFLWYDIPIPPYGNLLVSAYVLTIAYAIVKYELLNIKIAITRWSLFTVIHVLIFSVPISTFILNEKILIDKLGENWWIWFYFTGGIMGLIAQLIYNFIKDKTESRLLREQNEYYSFLRTASDEMLKIKDPELLQNRIVNVLNYDIRIDFVNLFLIKPNARAYELAASSNENQYYKVKKIERKHPLIKILKSYMEVISYETLKEDIENEEYLETVSEIMKSLDATMIIPIFIGKKLYGFIVLNSKKNNELYSFDYINILYSISNQFALAIDNAGLYQELEEKIVQRNNDLEFTLNSIQHDLAMAQQIQYSLMPHEYNNNKNLNFYIKYLPLSEIGGDLFDITELNEKYVRVFLADVSGFGVQAALITMLIKNQYNKLKRAIYDPSILIKNLNNEFISQYKFLSVYFTALVLDIDLLNNKIIYSSAAHPEQFLIQNNLLRPLKHSGPIIGINENIKFSKQEFEFNSNDQLLLFTSGLPNVVNSKREHFGANKLFSLLEQSVSLNQEEIIDEILSSLKEFSLNENNYLKDDITLIGIQNNTLVDQKIQQKKQVAV